MDLHTFIGQYRGSAVLWQFLVIWDVVIIDRDCNCNQMIYLRIHQSL